MSCEEEDTCHVRRRIHVKDKVGLGFRVQSLGSRV
jgi:hypothetical protein